MAALLLVGLPGSVCFSALIMAAEGDFLARYRAVSNKLKKRFLRKPNVAEASEQFGQLAKELKQQDCLQYAAFCNLAMARWVVMYTPSAPD